LPPVFLFYPPCPLVALFSSRQTNKALSPLPPAVSFPPPPPLTSLSSLSL